MSAIRLHRVAGQLRELVSDLLARKVHDPRLQSVRITDAEISPDLRHATLYYSVFPAAEPDHAAAAAAFAGAAGFLRREIGRQLRLRSTPELRFCADRSADHASHIEQLLSECRPIPPPPEPESDEK